MAWPAGSGRKFWIVSRSYLRASILMIGKKNAASSTFSRRRRIQSHGSLPDFIKEPRAAGCAFWMCAVRIAQAHDRRGAGASVDYLAYNPTSGDLIPGTGGVRKLR